MNFAEERQRMMELVKQSEPGLPALGVLTRVRQEFDLAIDDYRNSLSILSDTTYQDRKHFLLELIQNADDATFSGDPALTFRIYDDSIELTYNERGFTVDDVIAITGTGASTKTSKKMSNSFIGEKGIGFKSVFALASKVEIESPPWHFVLRSDSVIVPEPVHGARSLSLGSGTRIRVYFHDPATVDSVARELENYLVLRPESFLFLQRLSQFVLVDSRGQTRELNRLHVSPLDRTGGVLTLTQEPSGFSRSYHLYHEDLVFPSELVAERWERLGNSAGDLSRRLTAAAQFGEAAFQSARGRLFCYLPTNVTLPVPIYLQVDGHTKADREQLHDPVSNRWNKHLLEHIPGFLARAILAWRETKLANDLLRYVPVNKGEGQLSRQMEELMKRLNEAPWVKTSDPNRAWASPSEVTIPSAFLQTWFTRSPDFRDRVQEGLGKLFVDPEWTQRPEWAPIATQYSIRAMSGPEEARIFAQVKLPEEMFDDSYFVELLRYLEDFSRRWKRSASVLEGLLSAPLFPQNGKFQPLKGSLGTRAYWVSTRSGRRTGLEGLVNIRVVDTAYTVTRQEPGKETPSERVNEVRRENERNELMRSFLTHLGVAELNDDTLLIQLQIPFLRQIASSNNERLSVLRQVFEVYRAKRSDGGYLSSLTEIGEAMFLGNKANKHSLKRLLLPPALRLRPEDHILTEENFEYLVLPDDYLTPPQSTAKVQDVSRESDRRERLLSDWRAFLIHCGILAGPKFRYSSRQYRGTNEFSIRSPEKCSTLIAKVAQAHAPSKQLPLHETSVSLDPITLKLVAEGAASVDVVKAIYVEWEARFGHFSKAMWDETLTDYPFNPPPGYVKVNYSRKGPQSVLLRDSHWAGIEVSKIPVVDVLDQIQPAHKVRRLKLRLTSVKAVAALIPFVFERDSGNHKELLDSLNIPMLTAPDLNDLWSQLGEAQHQDMIVAITELVQSGFDHAGLCLWDKTENRLRPVSEFRLGHVKRTGVPLIEEQYGDAGRALGKLLGLGEETEATALVEKLQDAVRAAMNGERLNSQSQSELLALMVRWSRFTARMKREAQSAWTRSLDEMSATSDIILLWNQDGLEASLRENGRAVLGFQNVPDEAIPSLEAVAHDLGLSTIQSLGRLLPHDLTALSSSDRDMVDDILSEYKKLLEPDELGRLEQSITPIGGDKVGGHVFRVSSLERELSAGICVPMTIPLLDHDQGLYYIALSTRLDEALARLLSMLHVATYKGAIRDIRDIQVSSRKTLSGVARPHADRTVVDIPEDVELSAGRANANDDRSGSGTGESSSARNGSYSPNRSRTANEQRQSTGDKNWEGADQGSPRNEATSASRSTNGWDSQSHKASPDKPSLAAHSSDSGDLLEADDKAAVDTLSPTRDSVRNQVRERLSSQSDSASGSTESQTDSREWRLGMTPEEEESLRDELTRTAEESLRTGFEFREKVKRKAQRKAKYPDEVRVVDKFAGDPKEFLLREYDGQCQVCGTQLVLGNGRKWFEVYRIVEQKDAYWANRPYNTLGLCPNCHALGKFGGGVDLTSIETLALESVEGSAFPIEVEEFHGDFYVTDIIFNGQPSRLVVGKNHLAQFASLFTSEDQDVEPVPPSEEIAVASAETNGSSEVNIDNMAVAEKQSADLGRRPKPTYRSWFRRG